MTGINPYANNGTTGTGSKPSEIRIMPEEEYDEVSKIFEEEYGVNTKSDSKYLDKNPQPAITKMTDQEYEEVSKIFEEEYGVSIESALEYHDTIPQPINAQKLIQNTFSRFDYREPQASENDSPLSPEILNVLEEKGISIPEDKDVKEMTKEEYGVYLSDVLENAEEKHKKGELSDDKLFEVYGGVYMMANTNTRAKFEGLGTTQSQKYERALKQYVDEIGEPLMPLSDMNVSDAYLEAMGIKNTDEK